MFFKVGDTNGEGSRRGRKEIKKMKREKVNGGK